MGLAIAILLILLFLVALGLSYTSWRWFHMLICFCVFVSAVCLTSFSALSLKTRTAWMRVATAQEAKLEELREQIQLIEWGDRNEAEPSQPTVHSMQSRLARLETFRGRVWRGCTAALNNNQLQLTTPGDQPHRIQEGAVLFGFLEASLGDDVNVPVVYMGEYRVQAQADTTVALQPVIPLDPNQQAHLGDNAPWTLYEVMPVDGHRLFSRQDSASQELDDREIPIFGEMDKALLDQVFGQVLRATLSAGGQAPDDALVTQLADQLMADYLRSGKPAEDTDQTEDVWIKVQFVKADKVDVDSAEAQVALESNLFDPSGMALSNALRHGGPVEFEPNDYAVFPKERADQLVESGVCKPLGSLYVRPLHDYQHRFHEFHTNRVRLAEDAVRIAADTKLLDQSKASCDVQITFRTGEKQKLEMDLTNHQRDLTVIREYHESLKKQHTELLADLRQMYAENVAMARQLAARQAELARQINERTAAVSGGD